jgi:hypothetical protein
MKTNTISVISVRIRSVFIPIPHTQVVSKMASPEPLPVVVTNELLAKMLWASFPPVHYGSHTTNVIDVVS